MNRSLIISSVLHGALIFITATEIEACPNIAIESLSSGCAVISADTIPLKEIYKDAAIFFKKRDTFELAKQMARLVDDPITRNVLSKKALRNSIHFCWEKCAERTYELIKNHK